MGTVHRSNKLIGAGACKLNYLLSGGFLDLPRISSVIVLPFSYLFFEDVVLPYFPYHAPVWVAELFIGLLLVGAIAFLMFGSQAL